MQFSGNTQIFFVWRVISMHIALRIGRTPVLTMHNLWIQGSMKIIMLAWPTFCMCSLVMKRNCEF